MDSFSFEVIKKFEKAGWVKNRNVGQDLEIPNSKANYPNSIIRFLSEYGNLTVEGLGPNPSELVLSPLAIEENELLEMLHHYEKILGEELFPVGYERKNATIVHADTRGYIFTEGDYFNFFGSSIVSGIENILRGRWDISLQLDEDSGKWWNYDGEYVDLEKHILEYHS